MKSCASAPPSTYIARWRSIGSESSASASTLVGQAVRAWTSSSRPAPSSPTTAALVRRPAGVQTFFRSQETSRIDWTSDP